MAGTGGAGRAVATRQGGECMGVIRRVGWTRPIPSRPSNHETWLGEVPHSRFVRLALLASFSVPGKDRSPPRSSSSKPPSPRRTRQVSRWSGTPRVRRTWSRRRPGSTPTRARPSRSARTTSGDVVADFFGHLGAGCTPIRDSILGRGLILVSESQLCRTSSNGVSARVDGSSRRQCQRTRAVRGGGSSLVPLLPLVELAGDAGVTPEAQGRRVPPATPGRGWPVADRQREEAAHERS
jgi:hypothetical protein